MPNPAVFSTPEKEETGRGLQLWPVLSPGAGGQGVLLQGLPPRRGLQVGLAGPVGVTALGAAQAELSPAGVIQGKDELPPGTAHLAAAAQVRERKVGQDNPPQLDGEAAHLHGSGGGSSSSRDARLGSTVTEGVPGNSQSRARMHARTRRSSNRKPLARIVTQQ